MANSKRKCGYCGQRKPAESMHIVGVQAFCNVDHWIENQVKSKDKLVKKGDRIRRTTNRKNKLEFDKKDIKWQHKQTQRVFNKMRVLEELLWFKERNLEPECISCGKQNMDWCCGHFKSRGAQSNLRYDEQNTYLQCNRYCNMALSGNIEGNKTTRGYKIGLRERFGETDGNARIEYCETHTDPHKWTCDELEERRKQYNERIREIEKIL